MTLSLLTIALRLGCLGIICVCALGIARSLRRDARKLNPARRCEVCGSAANLHALPFPSGDATWCELCILEGKDILEEVRDNLTPDGVAIISPYSRRSLRGRG